MDLSLISTQDLVTEITRRNDLAIIILGRRLSGENEETMFNYHGSTYEVIGALTAMKHKMLEVVSKGEQKIG